ncbi:uncharacterized protein BDW47DRAFT_105314 [Aspergillus candidus]|uniref:Uncharacterized protein n=1 Tax=Aspergillus candidus TaxID=41067 RepID=A0A2I2FCM4_ASPCN|nr:hypothetical protein BDW47DRAFT_105314 [Aspergillus candidus]PLB38386.1 hypothetical protein BDW47DRAFT_105314 [Aspergillus candidus]
MSPTCHPAILRQPGRRMTDLRRNASLTHALIIPFFFRFDRSSLDGRLRRPFLFPTLIPALVFDSPILLCADLLGLFSCVYYSSIDWMDVLTRLSISFFLYLLLSFFPSLPFSSPKYIPRS